MDQRTKEGVAVLEKYLKGKHQDELNAAAERYASLEQKYQDEVTHRTELEQQKADFATRAKSAIATWSEHAHHLEAKLADAEQQLQQQIGTDTSPHAHDPLLEEQAATINMLTSDNNSLKQEMHQLQQEAAVNAQNAAAQQQLVRLQSDVAEANHKAEESFKAGAELLHKAKQAEQEAAAAKEAFAQKEKQVNDFCKKILDQVQGDASQYAQDMKGKDEEIKRLKDRSSHRQGSNGKRSRDDSHDRRDSGRN